MEEAAFFWKTVKTLIKENHITQDILCDICHFPISTFKHWIFKSIFPDALQTYKIAKALNTSVEYLITGENSVKPDTSELEKTLNLALSQLKNL